MDQQKLNYDINDIGIFNSLITWFNNYSINSEAPHKPQSSCLGNICYINNFKIKLELIGAPIFFDYSDTMELWPDYRSNLVEIDSILNIFFVYLNPTVFWDGVANPVGNISKYSFFADPTENYIVMNRDYVKNDLWGTLKTFRHEIHHMFGLWHLWDYSETCNEFVDDYLADIFNSG